MKLMPSTPSLFPGHATSDWISAHCDGGARGNPGPAGYGAILTDADGNLLAELSEFLGIASNNVAEYSGLLGCLDFALKNNYRRLRVVSDSELMVKQIQGKYQVKSPDLKPLFLEAKSRIARLDAFEISHALRHKNKHADRLANEAMDRGMKRPHAPGQPAPPPLKATPYPTKSSAPPAPPPIPIATTRKPTPHAAPEPKSDATPTMLRGFTRDGVIHVLGAATLPNGIFVKIIPE